MSKATKSKSRQKSSVQASPAADLDQDGVLTPQETQIKLLQDRIRKLEREKQRYLAHEHLLVGALKNMIEDDPPMLLYHTPPRPKIVRKHDNEEIAVVFLSDIHYGKVTPTYNSAVCEQRLMVLADKVAKITNLRRNQAHITELHILMGGDMIEGENLFPTQAHLIDRNLLDQSCKGGPAAYLRMIQRFLGEFEKIKILCVPGNHGRNGSKHVSNHPHTNWDRVFYHQLQASLQGLGPFVREELADRLTFEHSEEFYAIDRVGQWGILMVHGDQIKGGLAGMPYYGVAKKANGWKDALQDIEGVPESWDYLFFGHFHTLGFSELNQKQWFANGSLESHNTFAQENMASAGPAAQWLFYFDPEHGMINQNVLYLEPRYSDVRLSQMKVAKYLQK